MGGNRLNRTHDFILHNAYWALYKEIRKENKKLNQGADEDEFCAKFKKYKRK